MQNESDDRIGAHAVVVFSCLVKETIQEAECLIWVVAESDGGLVIGPLELHLQVDGQNGHLASEVVAKRVKDHIHHLDHPESIIKKSGDSQRTSSSHLLTVSLRGEADPEDAFRAALAFVLEAIDPDIKCYYFPNLPGAKRSDRTKSTGGLHPYNRVRRMFRQQPNHGGAWTHNPEGPIVVS